MKTKHKALLITLLAVVCVFGTSYSLKAASSTATVYNVVSNQIPLRLTSGGSIKSIIATNAKLKINSTKSGYYNVTLVTKSSNKYYTIKHKVRGKYYTNFYVKKTDVRLSRVGNVTLNSSNYTYKLPTNKALYKNVIKDCNYRKVATINEDTVGFYNYNSASSEVHDLAEGTKVVIVDTKGMFTKVEVPVETEKAGIYKRATYKMPSGKYKAQLCVPTSSLDTTKSSIKILAGYNVEKKPVRGKYSVEKNVTVSNGKVVVKSDDSVYIRGVEYETERESSYLESVGSLTMTYKKNDKIYKLIIPSGSYAELVSVDGDYYNVKVFNPTTQKLKSGKEFTYYRQVYLGDTSIFRVKSNVYKTITDTDDYKIVAINCKYNVGD